MKIIEADNRLQDLHNSSYHTKPESNNYFTIHPILYLFLTKKHTNLGSLGKFSFLITLPIPPQFEVIKKCIVY